MKMKITVACENPRCRDYQVEHVIEVDASFVGAHCHPCGVVLGRNGYPYAGHRIPDEVMAKIKALPRPAEWEDSVRRAQALQRLIEREMRGA